MMLRHGLIAALLACAVLLTGCNREADTVEATAPSVAPASTVANAKGAPRTFDALVVGVDYAVIDAAPTPQGGTPIEVAEAFSYACPHCAAFEPELTAWRAGLPADVRFEAVPMPLNEVWTEFARSYYAAVDLGIIERTHAALFEALHAKGVRIDSADALIQWYADTAGVDAAAFRQAMYGPGTDARIAVAQSRAAAWGIESTPTLIIGNRYRVMGFSEAEGGFERTLAVADALVAALRSQIQADS